MLDTALTLAWLRYRMFLNRSFHGLAVANLAASVLMGLSMGLLSLGIGFGMGAFLFVAERAGNAAALSGAFHLALGSVFGTVLLYPVLFGGGEGGIDPRRLLPFPIGTGRLYALQLGSDLLGGPHLFAYPTLLAVAVMGIIVPGKDPAAGLAVLALFAAATTVWGNLLHMGLQGLLRRRHLRELFVIVTALFLTSVGLIPHLVVQFGPRFKDATLLPSVLKAAWAAVSCLPPMLAARALMTPHAGGGPGALGPAAGLLLYLVAGVLLGRAVFRRTVLDAASIEATPATKAATRAVREAKAPRIVSWLEASLPPEVLAVWVKDWRTLLRSSVGKMNLLMVPLVSFFVVTVFFSERLRPFAGYEPRDYVFLFIAFYISMISNNLSGNAFAWEGRGMKAYYTAPAPGRRILLGKNLAGWSYALAIFLLFGAVFVIGRGAPRAGVLASGALGYAIAVVVYSTVGNFISVLFPKKNDIASWKMSSPSSMAVLAYLLVMLAVLLLLSAAVLLPAVLHFGEWSPLILLALLSLALLGYKRSLGPAGRLMESRREDLIRTLGSAD
jgi:hypothetical protein